MRYTFWTIVLQFLLTNIAFFQPVLLPVATSQGASIILRAFAELGFIISAFLSFMYGMLALFPLVFCASLITSYTVVSASDLNENHQLILLGGICLVINLLFATSLCCFIRRRTPKGKTVQECIIGASLLEYQPGRTFSEFLTRSKSQNTLKAEHLKFENFTEEISNKTADSGCHSAGFFLPRDP